MKKFSFIASLALCSLVSVCCTSSTERATTVASSFLSTYYSADYDSARTFCTPHCSELIGQATANISSLPDVIQAKIKEASAETSFEIVSVDAKSVEGEASVIYLLHVPGLEKPLSKRLVLKLEGRTALVDTVE